MRTPRRGRDRRRTPPTRSPRRAACRPAGRGRPDPCRRRRPSAPGRPARRAPRAARAAARTRRTALGGPCRTGRRPRPPGSTTTWALRNRATPPAASSGTSSVMPDGDRRADARGLGGDIVELARCRRTSATSITFSGQSTRSTEPGAIVRGRGEVALRSPRRESLVGGSGALLTAALHRRRSAAIDRCRDRSGATAATTSSPSAAPSPATPCHAGRGGVARSRPAPAERAPRAARTVQVRRPRSPPGGRTT